MMREKQSAEAIRNLYEKSAMVAAGAGGGQLAQQRA
jgi:hypothetical protein